MLYSTSYIDLWYVGGLIHRYLIPVLSVVGVERVLPLRAVLSCFSSCTDCNSREYAPNTTAVAPDLYIYDTTLYETCNVSHDTYIRTGLLAQQLHSSMAAIVVRVRSCVILVHMILIRTTVVQIYTIRWADVANRTYRTPIYLFLLLITKNWSYLLVLRNTSYGTPGML